jgi:hypothetical protein
LCWIVPVLGIDLVVGDARARAYGFRDLGLKRQEVVIGGRPLSLNIGGQGHLALSRELVEPVSVEGKGDLQSFGQRAIEFCGSAAEGLKPDGLQFRGIEPLLRSAVDEHEARRGTVALDRTIICCAVACVMLAACQSASEARQNSSRSGTVEFGRD